MHKILPETKEDFIAIEVSGKLNDQDYKVLVPLFESALEKNGEIDLFWEMKDFEGWTAGGLWEDIKFDVKHFNDFKRIAMVGNRDWEGGMSKLMKPVTPAEVRFFNTEDREKALHWAADVEPG